MPGWFLITATCKMFRPCSSCFSTKNKTATLSHLYIETIILPRQARDKHRESTQKKMAFFAPAGPALRHSCGETPRHSDDQPLQENGTYSPFWVLSLCLARACRSKMAIYIYIKTDKKYRNDLTSRKVDGRAPHAIRQVDARINLPGVSQRLHANLDLPA
jgi:hypothetical protein